MDLKDTQNTTVLMDPSEWRAALIAIDKKVSNKPSNSYVFDDSVAVIPVKGLLLSSVPDYLKGWFNATGYDEISEQVTEAASNPAISSIVLDVDSGGGMVSGVDIAADAIFNARSTKPVIAYVSGMAASAAYWLASQASEIQAGKLAQIGSIGVYTVLYDMSKAYENDGITVHVVRSTPLKGTGAGDAVTEEQLAAQQEIIDDIAKTFISYVANGRNISTKKAEALAIGKLWMAESAAELGLVDRITSGVVIPKQNGGTSAMSEEQKEISEAVVSPVASASEETEKEDLTLQERARCADLVSTFANYPDFLASAIKDGLTVEQAKAKHYDYIVAQKKQEKETAVEAETPVKMSGEASAAVSTWAEAVRAVAERDNIPMRKAALIADREYPGLRNGDK